MPGHIGEIPASALNTEYIVLQDLTSPSSDPHLKLAVHTESGDQIALKYIRKRGPQQQEKIWKEVEHTYRLKHPHIARLYGAIDTTKHLIIVQEYVEGGDLFRYLVSRGRLPEAKVRALMAQLVSALEYIHSRSLCHRDIKPENIMLDERRQIKLVDFGFSAKYGAAKALTDSCGSPTYAAPEIVRGAAYRGPEVDVWSAGVVLYVMLCGAMPFEGSDLQETLAKIERGTYVIHSYLSEDARSLLSAMLTVDPQTRIASFKIRDHPFLQGSVP
ncbi:kinase-like domain-containing protein [Schizophyllum amplum]|uniref:Kinase-like domain-containing protein n=1 Tax=Schizophyllum amplum TaxID=97359 RepID=A0A550BWL1_9AGAR|nr:kinase-like domain-containing protein [Auriculariopsis ampla]